LRTVVGFLSREHGLNVLNFLVESQDVQVIKIYTHALNPKSQDPERKIRNDYSLYEEICKKNKIELKAIDSKKEEISDMPNCDYIIEVSWRYLISPEITKKAKIATFGIHRGKLPDYAGGEPIKQAIEKNEKEIILSAHYLDSEIDQGDVIESITHPVNYEKSSTKEKNIQRLRNEITPLFSKLVDKTINKLERNNFN